MDKANSVLTNEDFGNLTIKGISEIKPPEIIVSMTPQTWGWAALLVIITIGLAMKIRSYIKYRKKYGQYRAIFSALNKESNISEIYLFAKKIYLIKNKTPPNEMFLKSISNTHISFSDMEQNHINEFLYKRHEEINMDGLKTKLLKWVEKEL
ncbi:hypothetical protein [Halobacteriovorax sp. DPLXC-1]|uniref:hypothetical protein n=1 Tax=Halobacteriovorax sp. DPLXC-1 TaxID=3110771 RepID=UPI002FF0A7C3